MKCGTCGSENFHDARFCAFCGGPLRVPADERRVVTVVFADLVGFTTLSEHLDPERLKGIVDHAFERLVQDIHDFGGRVDKIIGDAVVALFGAPVAHEDDAERAVRAALRMHETLAAYSAEVEVDIRMRIGVNTGEVLVGALRAGGDYTAMGDVVNTASRLETSANPGEVLVGPATHAATLAVIGYESRGSLIIRGREGAVDVWAAKEALVPPGHRSRRHIPIVGRDAEVTLLRNLGELSMRNRRAQSLVIIGEAGVGKTRLVEELAPIMLGIEPTTVMFSGRCVPYGESNPWWPIAEVLRDACSVELSDSVDVARSKCTAAVREVMEPDAVADVTARLLLLLGYDDPSRSRDPDRLAESTRQRRDPASGFLAFLEATLRVRPVLMRLADLHWAEQVVIELVDEMMVRMARRPLVFVATGRRALTERWSPATGRHNTLVLNLGALPRQASEQLLDSILGAGSPQAVRDMLIDRSGGNPLYLEELATLIGGREHASATLDLDELPDTLRGLIGARIDDLTADEQGVLADASVWGPEGPVAALRELGQTIRGRADIDPLIATLSLKDILVAESGVWRFRSDLLREVAYSRLTKSERMRRHRGIAEYIGERRPGVPDTAAVDLLARHYGEAARLTLELDPTAPDRELIAAAIQWIGEAARRAADGDSWVAAATLNEQGIELAAAVDRAADLLRFTTGRGTARCELWDNDGAQHDAAAALDLADRLGDEAGRAAAELLRGAVDARSNRVEEAHVWFDRAIERFRDIGDERGRAVALRRKGMASLVVGNAREAEGPLNDSLVAFRQLGDRRGQAWALQNLAWIGFITGRTAVAEDRLADAYQVFAELGDPTGTAWCDGLLAYVRYYQGRFAEANTLARDSFDAAKRRGDRWGQAMSLVVVGATDLWEGQSAASAKRTADALKLFEQMHDMSWVRQTTALHARALAASGRVTESLAALERLDSGSEHSGWIGQPLMVTAGVLATLVHLGGGSTDGDRLFDDILSAVEGAENPAPVELYNAAILASLQRGSLDRAIEFAALCEREPGESGQAPSVVRNGYALSAPALLAAVRGEHDAVAALLASDEPVTYTDRALLHVAVALGRGEGWLGNLAFAESVVRATDDVVSQATVALAKATIGRAVGHLDAPRWEALAAEHWDAIGIEPSGWTRVFLTAVATMPAAPMS